MNHRMKLALLAFVVLVGVAICSVAASAGTTVVTVADESSDNNNHWGRDAGSGCYQPAQSFTVPANYPILSSVEAYTVADEAVPNRRHWIELRANNSGNPDSTVLDNSSVINGDLTDSAWNSFIMQSPTLLTEQTTHYFVVLMADSCNNTAYEKIARNASASSYAYGSSFISTNGGSTWAASNHDHAVRLTFENGSVVVLNSPADNTVSTNFLTVNFTFLEGQNATGNCSLYIDDVSTNTTNNVVSGTSPELFYYPSSETSFDWFINCSSANSDNWTTARTYTYGSYLDNCTTYSTSALNFSFYDELNNTALTGSAEYFFSWTGSDGVAKTYNNSESSVTNFDVCINSDANFTANYTVEYTISGYDVRDYVRQNFVIDNDTNQISLFALETSVSTAVTVHVTDERDDDLSDVLIEVERWNIAENSYELVESEITNEEGKVQFNLNLGSTEYRFRFYQYGSLVLTTTRYEIFDTELKYRLTEDDTTRLGEFLDLLNTNINLTHNNATNLVTMVWNDAGSYGLQYCLNVTDYNQTYHNACSSNSSGTLTYTITNLNVSYIAQALGQGASGNFYVLESINIDTSDVWETIGTELGLALSMLLYITIVMLAITNKNTLLGGAVAAVIMLYFFEIIPIGIGSVIGISTVAAILFMIMNKRGGY